MSVFCWLNDWPLPQLSDMPRQGPLNWREGSASGVAPALQPRKVEAPAAPSLPQRVRERIEAMATIMVAVAHADGQVLTAEIESLSLLIEWSLLEAGIRLTPDETGELLVALAGIEPNEAAIDAACDKIVADSEMASAIGSWVRQIAFSDGRGSRSEAKAIFWLAERMKAAHGRRTGR